MAQPIVPAVIATLLAGSWPAPATGQAPALAAPATALSAQAETAAQTADPVAPPRCRTRPVVFGCANAANLMETASPADLAVGRPLSHADGALEAAAIARLRADKVKDLRREGPDSAGGAPQ